MLSMLPAAGATRRAPVLPTAGRRPRKAVPVSILGPLTPAAYVTLRREAAGLSIAQVAERIEPRIRVRRDIASLLRVIERPGTTARDVETLRPLKLAFPIDLEVYAQLRDEAPEHHPRVCRACGCSQCDPCLTDDHSCCSLIGASACTRCLPEVAA